MVENFRAVRSLMRQATSYASHFCRWSPNISGEKIQVDHVFEVNLGNHIITYSYTASLANDGTGAVDCDSHRAVGPVRTIRGVF